MNIYKLLKIKSSWSIHLADECFHWAVIWDEAVWPPPDKPINRKTDFLKIR